jgi:hypothetical protein
MSETCPTVKIKTDAPENEAGYIVINESDFDETIHELFDAIDSNGDKVRTRIGDLREALTARGVSFDPRAKKPDLQALLDAAPPVTPPGA